MKKAFILAALSILMPWHPVAAQTFKCTDAAGKVTYSSAKCNDLGLKDAGEVRDRINVNPAYRPPASPAGSPAPAAANPQPPQQQQPAADAAGDERRCFTVAGAGGKKVTRCNDTPD